MDLLRVTKVDNVLLKRNGADEQLGTLHLTANHLIFTTGQDSRDELWLGYPLIHSALLQRPPRLVSRRDGQGCTTREELVAWAQRGSIRIRCHHFVFLTLRFRDVRQMYDVYASVKRAACVESIDRLYAFDYARSYGQQEGGGDFGWDVYDAHRELVRMGVGSEHRGRFWRATQANSGYGLCATYPPVLAVPTRISDTTLTYAAAYRSKRRLPVLSYLHANGASMTRSSQPMVGLKQARSVQDEKIVEAILATSEETGVAPRFGGERTNVIIDARPTTNAVVNRAVGAGSENMDHYRRCRKAYLGIDNIHVMRDALARLVDAVAADGERGVVERIRASRTDWLRHIANIIVGVRTIVETIAAGNHVLVHCSDGWDRTAQLTSLAQVCLDPYYRTMRGFAVLVEKEWASFGHQFTLRCGHLGHPDKFRVERAPQPRASDEDDGSSSSSSSKESNGSSSMSSCNEGGSARKESGADRGSARKESGADRDSAAAEPPDAGYDLLQTGSAMFGRFASRAFRGVQSRISSAIQAASDNLDDADDIDPFPLYPELQPGYDPRRDASQPSGGGFRLGRSKHDHETSPVFQQFLDCMFQLCVQFPTMFEFNEVFLLDLFYYAHSAQFGTFLGNCARERAALIRGRTRSVWSCMLAEDRGHRYANELYLKDPERAETAVIVPDPGFVQYWTRMFSGHDPAQVSGGPSGSESENIDAVDANAAEEEPVDADADSAAVVVPSRSSSSFENVWA
ncbi:phosphatidylinositol-3-phosphatase ymr1 [Coemansia sp. RSA 2599]|nr:phosphatidylinositol-3-phosphatase ymr1 [Coemansia sp. RSA 2598]KAJ1828721.1 phosphatidylinositol-3-phosphatase ymr1 [Coemansia sp. RSA 2599]